MSRRPGGSILAAALLSCALSAAVRAWAQPAPLNLEAQATGNSGQVVLNWTAPPDADPISGYNIYWATAGAVAPVIPGSTPSQTVSSSPVTATTYDTVGSYYDGLSMTSYDGQAFAYWVTTVDSSGESQPSGPVYATTGIAGPPGPTAAATGVSGTVALSWSPLSYPSYALSSYQIFYSTQSSNSWAPGLTGTSVGAAQTSALLTGLPDGVLTWFWVAGAVGLGPGAYSPGASALPHGTPAAPTLTAGVLSFGQGVSVSAALASAPDAPLAQVTIFEALNGVTGSVATLDPSAPSVTLSAGVLPCGVAVTLSAQTVDIAGDTGTPSQGVRLESPCSPTAQATQLNAGALGLSWTAPPGGASSYAVFSATYAAAGGVPPSAALVGTTPALSLTAPAAPGQSPWYQVYAVGPTGVTSAASNAVGLLEPPSQVQALPLAGGAYLSWVSPSASDAVGLSAYEVYYSSAAAFVSGESVFGVSPGAPSLDVASAQQGLTLTGLEDFTPYAFAVASQGGSVSGSASAPVTLTTGLLGPQLGSVATSPAPASAGVVFQAAPPPSGPGSTLLAQWTDGLYQPVASTVYTLYKATDAVSTPQTFNTITPVASASGTALLVSLTAASVPGPAWYFINVTDSGGADAGGGDTTNARVAASAYFAPDLSATTLCMLSPTADGRVYLRWPSVGFADTYSVYRATQDITTVAPSGVTYSALATGLTPAAFTLLDTVPASLTYTSQNLTYIDTQPVENSRNAYAVVASMQTAGGGSVFGPASNAVTRTPRVPPEDPGLWELPGGAGSLASVDLTGDNAGLSGYYVTATALADGKGVFLEWTASGDGSYPISYYTVYRGFSPANLSPLASTTWYSYAPVTRTVKGVSFVPSMPNYVDLSPPQPWSDLYYGVSATDVSGDSSPDIVTATVGAALPWPAPALVSDYYFSGSGQAALTWAPGTTVSSVATGSVTVSAGTFPFAYWEVQRVAAQGADPVALTGATSGAGSLTTQAETTFVDVSPPAGSPLYLIQAVDLQGNLGLPLGVSLTVPTGPVNPTPGAVTDVGASAALALTTPADAQEYVLGETLAWAPNPAADAVSAYEVFRQDSVLGLTLAATVASPPYTDPAGLNDAAGTWITYTVQAVNLRGVAGPASAPLALALDPPAPSRLSPAPDIPTGVGVSPAVGLVWQDALQIQQSVQPGGVPLSGYSASYDVFRSDNPSVPLAGCAGLTGTGCVDLAPLAQASYGVKSVAVTGAGPAATSTASACLSLTLTASAPAAPSALYARPTNAGVALTWTASTGAYEYWIYRSSYALTSAPCYADFLARVSGTAFTDTGTTATQGLSWTAQVQPYYAVAAAGPFAVGSAATVSAGLPAPTGLGAFTGSVGIPPDVSATVTLSWSPSLAGSLVTGYNVWRAGPGTQGQYLSTTAAVYGATNTYTDVLQGASAGLTNTVLSYTVMAQGVSVGACSAPVTATAYDLPGPPYALQGNGLAAGVDLTWKPSPAAQGVTGYAVAWAVLDGGPAGVSSVAASPAEWGLGGLVPGQQLAATVQALNSAGASPAGAAVTVTVNAAGPAAAPAAFTVQSGLAGLAAGQCGILLNISAPAATSLVVYRKPAPGAALPASPPAFSAPLRLTDAAGGSDSPYYLTTLPGTFTGMTDTSVGALYAYSYAVTAVDAAGLPQGESVPLASTPTSVTAFNTWAAPGLSLTAGNGQVALTWSAPGLGGAGSYPLVGYRLHRQQTGDGVTGTAVTPDDAGFPLNFPLTQTVYTDKAVVNGLPYFYDMTSVDSQGHESGQPAFPLYAPFYAPGLGATAVAAYPDPPPPPPSTLTATVGGYPNQATLQWVATQSDTASGALYNVYRRPETAASTTCTASYGPPLPDGFHLGPVSTGVYPSDVTMLVQTFVDGAPGAPDPPADLTPVCYAVSAVDSAGEGPKSQDLCVTPYNPLTPPNPGAWSASIVNTTQVLLTWPAMPAAGNTGNGGYGVQGYDIERSSNDGNTYTSVTVVAEPAGATSSTIINYTDPNETNGVAVKGVSYYYVIYPVDTQGNLGTSYSIKSVNIPSGQNALYVYRNSFNPVKGGFVPIQCGLQQAGTYWIKIFTLNGEYVDTVIPPSPENGQPADPFLSPQVDWNGTNARGQTVASGVYLIHLESPGYRADARVAVIK